MKKLTELQAFNAMSKLFEIYYQDTKSDDLGSILGSMSFVSTNQTADPAMWEIWLESLDEMNLKDTIYINDREAFLTIGYFLEEYFGTTDLEAIIDFLEKNIRSARELKLVDENLYKNWVKCIDKVLSVKDARDYFCLLPK